MKIDLQPKMTFINRQIKNGVVMKLNYLFVLMVFLLVTKPAYADSSPLTTVEELNTINDFGAGSTTASKCEIKTGKKDPLKACRAMEDESCLNYEQCVNLYNNDVNNYYDPRKNAAQ